MLTSIELQRIVTTALAEDAPWGDITGELTVRADQQGGAQLVGREAGVMACGAVVDAVFASIDNGVEVVDRIEDGAIFEAGQVLATISGPVRSLLLGERVSLNLLQRACGIATTTRHYVEAVEGTTAHIVDTRKTTPGLRALEKAAVLAGGGFNHRFSLSDAVMIKDNHIAAWRTDGLNVTNGLRSLKTKVGHTTHIEIEVDDLSTLDEVLAAGVVHSILLDNFSLDDLAIAVKAIDGACLIEASGRVNLSTAAGIAATGVDLISVGALTHSVRAVDIGFDFTQQ